MTFTFSEKKTIPASGALRVFFHSTPSIWITKRYHIAFLFCKTFSQYLPQLKLSTFFPLAHGHVTVTGIFQPRMSMSDGCVMGRECVGYSLGFMTLDASHVRLQEGKVRANAKAVNTRQHGPVFQCLFKS